MRERYASMQKLSADRYHLAFALGKALEERVLRRFICRVCGWQQH